MQDRMLPNAEKVSYNALLSIDLSRDLMKTLPVPDLRRLGSRWHHLDDTSQSTVSVGNPPSCSGVGVRKMAGAGGVEEGNRRIVPCARWFRLSGRA